MTAFPAVPNRKLDSSKLYPRAYDLRTPGVSNFGSNVIDKKFYEGNLGLFTNSWSFFIFMVAAGHISGSEHRVNIKLRMVTEPSK